MTKQTIKRKALKAGHNLENWKARKDNTGKVLYNNANCQTCGRPFFDDATPNFSDCKGASN